MKLPDEVVSQWQREMNFGWTGADYYFNDAKAFEVLIAVDELVSSFAKMKQGTMFEVTEDAVGRRSFNAAEPVMALLSRLSQLDTRMVMDELPRHRFGPYFELLERYMKDFLKGRDALLGFSGVNEINRVLRGFWGASRSSAFLAKVKNRERVAKENWKSLELYLNRLFSMYSNLLFVRVDLGYRHDPQQYGRNWTPPCDEKVKQHFTQVLDFFRAEMPSLVGYVWKFEYRATNGPHWQVMLICNGQEMQDDGAGCGELVGYWWQRVAGEDGIYWNCNLNKQLCEAAGRQGIGLIRSDDEAGRAGLIAVCMYLAKADYYARYMSPVIKRTFGRAAIKTASRCRLGKRVT